VARIALIVLIVQALIEARHRVAASAVGLGLVGLFGIPVLNPALVTSYLAIVDIVFVLVLFRGDIRLN
jgi:hypothetical protein